MGRFSATSALRATGVSLAYLVVWIGLDLLARGYGWHGAVIPWYPGVAVIFYVFYTFGGRYWPLPIIAEFLRSTLFPATNHMAPLAYMGFGALQSVGYVLAAWVVRGRLRVRLPLVSFRDASNFCAAMMITAALMAFPVTGLGFLLGRIPLDQFWNQAITYWIGDGVALVAFVPALAMYVTPLVAPRMVHPDAKDDDVPIGPPEQAGLVIILLASLAIGYATVLFGVTADPILYFTFLPLVLIAARGGLRMAIPAIVAADLLTTAFTFVRPGRLEPLEFQSYIAISAVAALAVGALVTQYHRRDRRNRLLLYADPLTGLANRAGLESWLADAQLPVTVATFDIDRKRLTTSGLNRETTDELLVSIARRLNLVDAALSARVESDEFACAFEGIRAEQDIAKGMFALFDEPFAVGESEVFLTISLGIAHAHTPDAVAHVLRDAGLAMYRAKRGGRGEFVVATPEIAASEGDTSLIAELHRAHRDGEFALFYQPVMKLSDAGQTCVGVEALLRWEHPTLGLLEPAAFLETLESLRLADRVGRWVLDESCRQLQRWEERGLVLDAWINLFPRQVVDPHLASHVSVAAAQGSVATTRIIVEVLEGVVAENDVHVSQNIRALRDLGVRTAIDDFGTGHSSLSRLREIPADIMKIDRSFINRSEDDPKARGVIQAVLQIAGELRYTSLAEGVENEAQLDLLRSQGCQLVQGYYLGRPMRAGDLEAWAATRAVL